MCRHESIDSQFSHSIRDSQLCVELYNSLSPLEHLISLVCKIEKGTKSILQNNSIAQKTSGHFRISYLYQTTAFELLTFKKGALEWIVEPPF